MIRMISKSNQIFNPKLNCPFLIRKLLQIAVLNLLLFNKGLSIEFENSNRICNQTYESKMRNYN